MMLMPWQVDEHSYSVFVVLDDSNWTRITAYDPAEVPLAMLGQPWDLLVLRDLVIGYANPADVLHMRELQKQGKSVTEILKYLSRGFAYRPDQGDVGHDERQ